MTRVIGMGVCGPNEPYLEATLREFKRLCDDTVIALCNATDKEKELVESYGFTTVVDNREWGKHQWRIKEDLLKHHIMPLEPGWVVALDMDETFDTLFTREELEKLAKRGGIGYYFFVANLYDDGYAREWSRWNIRMFKPDPEYGLEWAQKPVHCGLAPKSCYSFGNYAPFVVKHYGLKEKSARDIRVERYKKYDPDQMHLSPDYYRFLASEAPVTPFIEEELHNEVATEVKDYHFKLPRRVQYRSKNFVYVRNPAGNIVDIPEEHLAETLKRPGFELIK